jgi:hypothetical protein
MQLQPDTDQEGPGSAGVVLSANAGDELERSMRSVRQERRLRSFEGLQPHHWQLRKSSGGDT